MSFKTHLIIISCIILAVYLAWRWMESTGAQTPAAPVEPASAYSITITHASWGLNCRLKAQPADNFAQEGRNEPLREDNALATLAEQCNGKLQCGIPVTSAALGFDPAPNCVKKELHVEYRCFSYDRPWAVKASSGTLTIDCDKARQKE